ncbi:MAG: cation transporter [Bacteroidales bacterium]|nr:cation transporter [Bacteroidales bacterium]
MKKRIFTTLLTVLVAAVSYAKDIKTVVVTTTPQMHCESCENKIKGNLRFERGVKKIETNIDNQTVTITYDADKTTVQKLIEGFAKFGYTAKEVKKNESETEKK